MKLFFCIAFAGTIFLAVCATISYAQPVMGIKVGPSLVTNKSRTYQSAYRICFEAGLFSEFKIDKQFFLLTELLYAMKGCGGNGTLNLQYLCVPVLAGYHIGRSIDLVFGPEICFLLKGDVDFPNMSSINTTSQHREIDIALNIGARYRLAKKWGGRMQDRLWANRESKTSIPR